jgi:hypothetical protein
VAIKLASFALIFIGAWGAIILFALAAVFSYFVFAGKSFISRQFFAIAIFSFVAVSFVIGSELSLLVGATVIAGVFAGAVALAWQIKKEKLIPMIKLAMTSVFGLAAAGVLCSSFGVLIWPLITGARGKKGCFGLLCAFLILMLIALILVLIFWYKHYFLPAWRNSRLRQTSGS